MIMQRYSFRVSLPLILVFLLGSPLWANICVPEQEEKLKVVGVASNDTLNVREGYTTNYKVVTKLLPDQDAIEYVDVVYKSDICSSMCANHFSLIQNKEKSETIKTSSDRIKSDCRLKSKIWYKISTNSGIEGWASAKYLDGYFLETASQKQEKTKKSGMEHLVVKGDTAYSISRKYGISIADLASLNNLDSSYSLKLGQRLLVSASADKSAVASTKNEPPKNESNSKFSLKKRNNQNKVKEYIGNSTVGFRDLRIGSSVSEISKNCSAKDDYSPYFCFDANDIYFSFLFVDVSSLSADIIFDTVYPSLLSQGILTYSDKNPATGKGEWHESSTAIIHYMSVEFSNPLTFDEIIIDSSESRVTQLRKTLEERYTSDFETTERDRDLLLQGSTDKLHWSFENGKVSLLVRNHKGEFKVSITYRSELGGEAFLKSVKPKKSNLNDF